jgi:hypothetical protein
MFLIIEQALKNLGIDNFAVYGSPTTEAEFYEFVKPVIGVDESGTNQFASDASEYTVSYDQFRLEVDRLQFEYDAQQYARARVQEYPSIGDQLDALFHAGVFPPEMAAQIQAVKDRYPKN